MRFWLLGSKFACFLFVSPTLPLPCLRKIDPYLNGQKPSHPLLEKFDCPPKVGSRPWVMTTSRNHAHATHTVITVFRPLKPRTVFASSCVLNDARCPPRAWQDSLAPFPLSGGGTQTCLTGKGNSRESGTPGQTEASTTTDTRPVGRICISFCQFMTFLGLLTWHEQKASQKERKRMPPAAP